MSFIGRGGSSPLADMISFLKQGSRMEFFNGTSLEDIVGKSIDVYLKSDSDVIDSILFCDLFLRDGIPTIDFLPKFKREYTAPLPSDSVVSRNEVELSVGRYAVFISHLSEAGRLATGLLQAKNAP